MDNAQEVKDFIKKAADNFKNRVLTIVEIESVKSIKKNFEVGGRPLKWKKSKKSKKNKGTKTLVISGNLSNVSATRNDAESSVVLMTNPLTRAYGRAQNYGAKIYHPPTMLKFRKKVYRNGTSRIIFAGSKHKRIIKKTMSKAYTVVLPKREFMIIPDEDIKKWIKLIEG